MNAVNTNLKNKKGNCKIIIIIIIIIIIMIIILSSGPGRRCK